MATIHPHKGYLSTKFQLLNTDSTALSYEIRKQGSNRIERNGTLQPSIPINICMSSPGKYNAVFEDGTRSDFIVEDGFKFGGSSHKKSFVFDDCPWIFIVMRDRTYFHNRESGEEYVECISPDDIIEVSRDYVLMKNDGQEEVTLYSLASQKPTICVSNIIFHNHSHLAWRNDLSENKHKLVIYSISKKEEKARKCFDFISVDVPSSKIFYAYRDVVHIIDLKPEDEIDEQTFSAKGSFGAFLQNRYAAFIEKQYGENDVLVVYDLFRQTEKSRISTNGNIARINDNEFINIKDRRTAILQFDLQKAGFPEANINATYSEYDIYPCKTDTFYKESVTTISSSRRHTESTCVLKSTESEINEAIGHCDSIIINDYIFCLYGHLKEFILIPLKYPSYINHRHDGIIHNHNDTIILVAEGQYSILSRNGFWDTTIKGNFNFSDFDEFGIIIEKESHLITKQRLGKFCCHVKTPINYIRAEKGLIFPAGDVLRINKDEHIPEAISPKFKYGIDVKEGKVTLYTYNGVAYGNPTNILETIFDTSSFSNVIMSENGHQIMYRNNDCFKSINLESGRSTEFKNLSFVSHINGLQPQFRLVNNSQAILINPMTGTPIETDLLDEYRFISPDTRLYADKALGKYIEYYDQIDNKLITGEEYQNLRKRLGFLAFSNEEKKEAKQNRINFVLQNSDFLIRKLKDNKWFNRPIEEFNELLINMDVDRLIDLFIEKHGFAIIRKTGDNSKVAKIELGSPLWFLNYVSFSYDNHYVAIAGRYRNDSGNAGLFLVYDLIAHKIVIDNKSSYAVWTTAFTPDGTVAAYTSCPNSIVCSIDKLSINNQKDKNGENLFPIRSYNFLSFSPDGNLFACSEQGYIPYRNSDGSINSNWGHQPSSVVSLRRVDKPNDEIVRFEDISNDGVSGTFSKDSVASVSFSNDNSRLMMAGKDGCFIVRNLHLE